MLQITGMILRGWKTSSSLQFSDVLGDQPSRIAVLGLNRDSLKSWRNILPSSVLCSMITTTSRA